MQRVEQTAAYVLHSRPYRETSLLVDLFSLEHGRVRAVARGARRAGSRRRHQLQPFQPLQVSWQGRHELRNLVASEPVAVTPPPQGKALLCALYVNELLQRLLEPHDPMPRLYLYYTYLLSALQQSAEIEGALRTFERQLLEDLGYGIDFASVSPGGGYRYDPEQGLVRALSAQADYAGDILLAIAAGDYQQPDVRSSAKRLMRQALTPLLGDRPLKSRELFRTARRTA